ncbi:MAG: CvpA family protein, partial [Bacteroidota bacterium]
AWWQVWVRNISGTDQGSWVQWGLLVGILLGVQLVLMALNALISKFFKIIGLETAYRWGGAMLALLKWLVILSLVFHLIAQIPGGSSVLKSKFPWSVTGLLAMGKAIWTMGTSFF